MSLAQHLLFAPDLPDGFLYRPDLISESEEASLLDEIEKVQFADFEMRGVVARRRVAFFGSSYSGTEALPMPSFLLPLRARIAEWADVAPEAFAMALINEYRPGSPIGWHRDAPQYGLVAGVSLRSASPMRFRPYVRPGAIAGSPARRRATHEVLLERRSAYLMTGAARQEYEHHIPPVTEQRYSITFRTLR
jgi:alkylated DNA repair dioxygenase AlkB